ncbi:MULTISPECIES: hypothetical protein [unclassified Knoellia]|uniref:hypothetical protein n=1 Tax=Knoellia altitudinis TaxID=3404795 RepID=UPI0036177CB1
MTVIAFRPRRPAVEVEPGQDEGNLFTGVFRSPRGRAGTMKGHLRLQRIVIVPRGVFVTGVFTGELREPDGTVIGVDSRRCTVPADLQRDDAGLEAVIRPMQLDLMGILVDVVPFAVVPSVPFPPAPTRIDRRPRRSPNTRQMGRIQPR